MDANLNDALAVFGAVRPRLFGIAYRMLVSRARKHLAGERRREVSESEQRRLLTTFLSAAKTGDLEELERLFAEDVVVATVVASAQGINQVLWMMNPHKLGAVASRVA